MRKKKNYSKLYIDILKLGMSSVHTGIAFVQLEDKLVKKGYDFRNDCIELAVKQWFFDCFHHKGEDGEPLTDIRKLDDHLNCSFIMKGEACLTLVNHKKSKRNITIAWLSFAASLAAIAVGLFIRD